MLAKLLFSVVATEESREKKILGEGKWRGHNPDLTHFMDRWKHTLSFRGKNWLREKYTMSNNGQEQILLTS